MSRLFALTVTFCMTLICTAAIAQSPFQTVINVNDLSISQYELDQRVRLLTVLRSPGDLQEEARKGLIEDRLRISAARRQGIELTAEDIEAGITEFASRANLTGPQFIQAINAEGVATETLRDFVSAGLSWRQVIQSRFGARAQISDAEVDRALALAGTQGGARVLLAEIIVPLTPENAGEARALMDRLSRDIKTVSAFSAAARQYSAARTAGAGGRLEWLPIGNLPPQIRAQVLTLSPGQVTDPIDLGPGIGIFQLRALEEIETATPEALSVEYATILIPGGQSEAARAQAQKIADNTDTCDDLYTTAKRLPPEYFQRVSLPSGEVPGDIAMELAKLDANESSIALTRQDGAFLVFLRLCGRSLPAPLAEDGSEIDQRAQIRERLFQQRLASFSQSLLEELRADAIITEQ